MQDWAAIRAQTNEMRAHLLDPLSAAVTNISKSMEQARRDEIARLRQNREDARQAEREKAAGEFGDLAQTLATADQRFKGASGAMVALGGMTGTPSAAPDRSSYMRGVLSDWLRKHADNHSSDVAAFVLHQTDRLNQQDAEETAAAQAAGVPRIPGLHPSAYPGIAKRRSDEAANVELAPILDAVRAGKPIDPALRAKYQEPILREETAVRAQAKQKSDEALNLEEQGALEQMYADPAKLTPRQKALVAAKYQGQQRIDFAAEGRNKVQAEVGAVDAAPEEGLAGVAVTTPEGIAAKQRRVSFVQAVGQAREASARAAKSSDRADAAAAREQWSAIQTSAARDIDQIAPRSPLDGSRSIPAGMEAKVHGLQTSIDEAAGHIADLAKAGPGGASRVKELLPKVENGTASPAEKAEFLSLTGGK